jgi:hypothetical protein
MTHHRVDYAASMTGGATVGELDFITFLLLIPRPVLPTASAQAFCVCILLLQATVVCCRLLLAIE